MSLTMRLGFGGTITETIAAGYAGQNSVIQWGDLIEELITRDANTSPQVDTGWAGVVAQTAGTVTLTLEALTRTNMPDLDLTGKRVVAWLYKNLGTNAHAVAAAGTNGYAITGTGADSVSVPAGGILQMYIHTAGPAVSATVSDITIDGNGTETGALILVAGTI